MQKTVYEAHIVGIRPLLMHNGRLADPLDPMTRRLKELTEKGRGGRKTSEDHEAIARAEWEAGLYVLDDRIVVPADAIDALLRDGAKATRKGKAMVAGVEIEDPVVPLIYGGPSSWQKLYEFRGPNGARPYVDRRGAGVQKSRVVRTRPKFPEWELRFRIVRYDFATVGADDIRKALEYGGVAVGLLDFRPKFGLFRVERFEKAN